MPARALTDGLTYGLLFGLVFALTSGLTAQLRDQRTVPNEGIRRSARYALGTGISASLIVGLPLTGPFIWQSQDEGTLSEVLSLGLLAGLTVGVPVGLVFGGAAWLQHYRVRVLLVRAGAAPWRYTQFLESMVERLLLRRSGSGYLFLHRILRDYLADLPPDQSTGVTASVGRSH